MPTSSQPLPDPQSFYAWGLDSLAPPVDLGQTQYRGLRVLGHKVERFLAARAACARHLAKAQPTWPLPWLPAASPPPGQLTGDGLFACPATITPSGIKLAQPLLDPERTAHFASLWQQHDPAAPKSLPSVLPLHSDVNSPLWLALLRLRSLRSLWERELRRGTFESLLDHFADAWLLDPTPLPPGSVIPRLELPSWQALPDRRATTGRLFVTSTADCQNGIVLDPSHSSEFWRSTLEEALASYPDRPCILLELPTTEPNMESLLWVFYEKKGGRVDCLGALAFAPLIVAP